MAGRPTPISDPDFAKKVALVLHEGTSRAKAAEAFGVKDPDTITRWSRDPRVTVHLDKLRDDRINLIVRKVDGKIAAMLDRDDLTIKELIAVRGEFLGGAMRQKVEAADAQTIGGAQRFVEDPENYDLLDKFREAIENQTAKRPEDA